jgi:hypothetical protein
VVRAISDGVARDPIAALENAAPLIVPTPRSPEPEAAMPFPSFEGALPPGVPLPGALPPPGFPAGFMGISGGRPPPPAKEGRAAAQKALTELLPPRSDHPFMQYQSGIRARLAAQGLPTDAAGVRVYVAGETPAGPWGQAQHGPAIVRTISGPAGLARKADLRLLQRLEYPENPFDETASSSLDQLAKQGVEDLHGQIVRLRDEVRGVRLRLALNPSKGTALMSSSFGTSASDYGNEEADDQMDTAVKLGKKPAFVEELNAERAKTGRPPLDLSNEADRATARAGLTERIMREMNEPDARALLTEDRAQLAAELADGRKEGLLVFAAAGNAHQGGVSSAATESAFAGTPGLITVGAADIRDPKDPNDDQITQFSSPGNSISAPGAGIPTARPRSSADTHAGEKPRPVDADGTSFAGPYAVSVAALMVKANPKITPDQIEQILASPKVAHHIPNAPDDPSADLTEPPRDGSGEIDPVAAVVAARHLRR